LLKCGCLEEMLHTYLLRNIHVSHKSGTIGELGYVAKYGKM
jgi:hypothetical protein